MSQAAVQFDQQHYQDAREAYQDLNEVISDIVLDVKRDNDVTYSVVWKQRTTITVLITGLLIQIASPSKIHS
jgi:Na+-transporting NADH:ubiquinone oxidoreductase subunit NqrB